jgi:hypothetical protein
VTGRNPPGGRPRLSISQITAPTRITTTLGHAVETVLRKEHQRVVKSGRGIRLAPFGLKCAILVVVMGHA